MENRGSYGSFSSSKIGKMETDIQHIPQDADRMRIRNVDIAIGFCGSDLKNEETERFSEIVPNRFSQRNSGSIVARPSSEMSSISVSVTTDRYEKYCLEDENFLDEEQHGFLDVSSHGDGENVCTMRSPVEEKKSSYIADVSNHYRMNDRRKEELLERVKQLEKQVKKIPMLQIKISLLQEEKRFLENQLLSQKNQGCRPEEERDMDSEPPPHETFNHEQFNPSFSGVKACSSRSLMNKSNGSTSTLRFDSNSEIKNTTEEIADDYNLGVNMPIIQEVGADNDEELFFPFRFTCESSESSRNLKTSMVEKNQFDLKRQSSTILPKWTEEVQDFQEEMMRNFSPKPQIPVHELLHQQSYVVQEDCKEMEQQSENKSPTNVSLSDLLVRPNSEFSSHMTHTDITDINEESCPKLKNSTHTLASSTKALSDKGKPCLRAIVKPTPRNHALNKGKSLSTDSSSIGSDGIIIQRATDNVSTMCVLKVETKPLIFCTDSGDLSVQQGHQDNGFYLKVCSGCFHKINRAMSNRGQVPQTSTQEDQCANNYPETAEDGTSHSNYHRSYSTSSTCMLNKDGNVLQRRHSASPTFFKRNSPGRTISPITGDKQRKTQTAANMTNRACYQCHSLEKKNDYSSLLPRKCQELLAQTSSQTENRNPSHSEHSYSPSCVSEKSDATRASFPTCNSPSAETDLEKKRLSSCDFHSVQVLGDNQTQRKSTTGTYLSREKTERAESECEISEDYKKACRIVNSYLVDLEKERDESLRTPVLLVQQKWFEIAGSYDSKPEIIQKYIEFFRALSTQMLRWIINSADSNFYFSQKGNTVLNFALVSSKLGIVSILLDTGVCDLDKPNKPGYTALHLCGLANINSDEDYLIMKKLLSMGKINVMSLQHGQTPLMMAAGYGNTKIARLMVEAGANVNIQDHEGSTALMCAAHHGHMECTKYLLNEANCDSFIVDKCGMNACSIALVQKHTDVSLYIYFHNSERGKNWESRLSTPAKFTSKKQEK